MLHSVPPLLKEVCSVGDQEQGRQPCKIHLAPTQLYPGLPAQAHHRKPLMMAGGEELAVRETEE